MANYAKYTKGAMGHLLKHYERAKDDEGNYLKFGNQDIEPSRTDLNYNLAPEGNQLDIIHKRLEEVYCLKRKDVNVMCSWVVTMPKDLEKGKEREFFQEAYSFLEERYGKPNVVSSYVHMDEKTPHMHFCFIPIVNDPKKQREKVSAKECVTRLDLEQFHANLQERMKSRGISCTIINEATLEGNRAIKELKRGSAIEKLQEVHNATSQAKEKLSDLEGKIKSLEGKVLTLEEVNSIKIKKPLIGGQKAIIQMPYEDAINLKATASKVNEVDEKLKETVRLNQSAENKLDEARRIPIEIQRKMIENTQRVNDAEKKSAKLLNDVNKALSRCPKEVSDTFIKAYHEVGQEKQRTKSKGFDMER